MTLGLTACVGTRKPPAFKLAKVTVNAKLILQALDDLEPLCVWMNDSAQDHSRSIVVVSVSLCRSVEHVLWKMADLIDTLLKMVRWVSRIPHGKGHIIGGNGVAQCNISSAWAMQKRLNQQEAFEKCWAQSPLRSAARPNFTLPFTRCCYCRIPPLSHAACASMSTTTTTTTRDRGDRYGPMEWAQSSCCLGR